MGTSKKNESCSILTFSLDNSPKLENEDEETLDKKIDSLWKTEHVVVDIREISLNDCLKTNTDYIKSHMNTSNITIEINFDVFVVVRFNRSYLESIFLNLITNAIRYSNPNEAPMINIRTEIKEGVRQLIITDNGIGLNMENIRVKIFGFNQTIHNTMKTAR